MTIPDYQTLMLPLLQFLKDGKEHTKREAIEHLSTFFKLTDAQRNEMLPSGQQSILDNRVGWARTYLKKACLLESHKRGTFVLTERGKKLLNNPPSKITVQLLEQFPEFIEFKNASHLMQTYFQDFNANVHTVRALQYDKFGNIETENLYGNLTGTQNWFIRCNKQGKPVVDGSETYAKKFNYSKDELHLLLSEEEDNGRKIVYDYKKGTDLVTAKYLVDHDGIRMRRFYEYDKNNVVIKVITDDGINNSSKNMAGVTERRITRFTPRKDKPIGLPEKVEEIYFDTSTHQEVILLTIKCSYTKEGWLSQEDHFDSQGKFRYSLTWDYDDHGNVIKEKNARGQSIVRKYDPNDNLIYEKGPSPEFHLKHEYDYSNRLILTKAIHKDGKEFVTRYSYDYLGNRKSTTDPNGHETKYDYDDFGRLVSIKHSAVPDENGNLIQPIIEMGYDFSGNLTQYKDAKGHVTQKTYNARCQPVTIQHPDGTLESFEYNLDGTLKKSVAANGTITLYGYDFLGRVTSTENYSSQMELLSQTSSTYDAFHLRSTTDAEGNTTCYEYDGAGRLSAKILRDSKTTYEYDPLGRVAHVIEWNGTDGIVHAFEYDLLDRKKEERVEDLAGHVLTKTEYDYDAAGNCKQVLNHTQAGQSLTQTRYNSRNQPIEVTDPLGHVTYITYNENFINAFGQEVLQSQTTDPLGNLTIETYDIVGRVALIERRNPIGITTAKQEIYFDLNGNRSRVIDHVMVDGQLQRQIVTLFEYNRVNQLIKQVEAARSPDQKTTSFVYNAFGQKEEWIKPDGVEIHYTYDALGRLENYSASDNSFSYTYAYNRNSQLLCVKDNVNNTITEHTYDAYGNMQTETLGNGLQMKYNYDTVGRMTQLTLPNDSQVDYVYESAFLKEIQRVVNGVPQYSHQYTGYDQSGAVTGMKMPLSSGSAAYTYDLKRRPVQMKTKAWTQSDIQYDPAGNLSKYQLKDSQGQTKYQFAYDDLYQLSSETGFTPHAYQYDSVYNRISKDQQSYVHNDLNQLLSDGAWQYEYDDNGNLKSKTQGSQNVIFTYDALDRLVEVKDGTNVTTYQYDAFNRRLAKTHNGMTTQYLYQGQNEIGALENGNLVELRILGLGKGAEIGAAVALEIRGRTFVPLHDHNGNVATLLDEAGNVVETYRYSAYGEEKIFDAAGNSIEESAVGNSWRFSSKRYDSETGFIYFGRRYYAPEIGRWVTADPIGFDDGPNLYAYVHNNPLTTFDLYGLFDFENAAYTATRVASENLGRNFESVRDREKRDKGFNAGSTSSGWKTDFAHLNNYFTAFVQAIPVSIASSCCEADAFISRSHPGFVYGSFPPPSVMGARVVKAVETIGNIGLRAHRKALETLSKKSPTPKNGNDVTSALRSESESLQQVANQVKEGGRNRFSPDPLATGSHTVFRRDPVSRVVKHYETYVRQTNHRNPNPWESLKRYDGPGRINERHYNKATEEYIDTPHIHDPKVMGGIRKPEIWEIPL